MLLRRITKHVKEQNWFAVGIDFVIVVIGVFIGIQVANWNDGRTEIATFERKLSAVRVEMIENLERIEMTRAGLQRQSDDIALLRELFAHPEKRANDEEIQNLLWQSVRAIQFYPKRNALDAVLEYELFSELEDQALVEVIENWDATVVDLLREQRDELNFRDGFQNPYFAENLPLAAIFAQSTDTKGIVAPARFVISREEMAANPVLENILATRQLTAIQNFNNAGELENLTAQIIEKIEAG